MSGNPNQDGPSSSGDMLGSEWSPVFTSGVPLNAISGFVASPDAITAVGNSQTVVKGNGTSFTSATVNGANSNFLALWVNGAMEVWAAGTMGQVWRTTNAGTSWTDTNSGTTQTLRGIHAKNGSNQDIVAAGDDTNNARFYDGSSWQTSQHGRNDAMYGVWASNNTFWIVGTSGDAGTSTDPTNGWTNISDISNGPRLNAVAGVDDNNVWGVTESGSLYKFDGPRTQWNFVVNVPSSNLRAMWVHSATEIWVAGVSGSNGIVYRCDANAKMCTNQSNSALAQHSITGIWGNGSGAVWVTANTPNSGTIFKK